MTKSQQRESARLDARYLANLCRAADLIDALAESGDPRRREATHDIAGHLRNAGMFTPNLTLARLREAEEHKRILSELATVTLVHEKREPFKAGKS